VKKDKLSRFFDSLRRVLDKQHKIKGISPEIFVKKY